MKWAQSTASLVTRNANSSSFPSTITSAPASTATRTVAADVKSLWANLLKDTSITGRQLFEQDMRASTSTAINDHRKSEGISPRMHVGMLRTRLKEMWEELDESAKQDWQRKATDIMKSAADDILTR